MSRYAYSQFCDDVRQEIGNKVSLMGIYGGQLIVADVPFAMPKLCCVITCTTPADQPFSSLNFRVSADGTEVARGELPSDAFTQAVPQFLANSTPDDPIKRYGLSLTLVLSPYLIQKAHLIKTYVIADGEELIAGRLNVMVTPSST